MVAMVMASWLVEIGGSGVVLRTRPGSWLEAAAVFHDEYFSMLAWANVVGVIGSIIFYQQGVSNVYSCSRQFRPLAFARVLERE